MNRHSRNIAALLKNQTARRLSREERRRRAQRTRILLTYLCFLALLSLALLRLAVPVKADATQPQKPPEAAQTAFTDGRSPGDDTPALVACYMDTEQAENELIQEALLSRAHKLENVTITHYDCCVRCCGKSDGITASGRKATPGVTVGVDPAIIPLGSDVLVDYGAGELHYLRADDTGSSVNGKHLDVCVESHEKAISLGVKTATVYWAEQEEP